MTVLKFESLEDLESLVKEETEESSFLEFKSSRIFGKGVGAAADDLSKEITAFANGGGGVLVVGIDETNEDRSKASKIAGITKQIGSERLQQLLESRISPPIPNLSITEIEDRDKAVCFVIKVLASALGPHQASDLKYYARRQYQKLPMAHYEIEDIRNRSRVEKPKISLRIEFTKDVFTELVVENLSHERLFDVTFQVADRLKKIFKWEAPALNNGISCLNPGDTFFYNLGTVFDLFKSDELKQDNNISVKYSDKFGKNFEEVITFNLLNHELSSFSSTEVGFLREQIVKQLKETTNSLDKIGKSLEHHLAPLTSNTGLKLSQLTLEHLKLLENKGADCALWNPLHLDVPAIQEILKCDNSEARQLYHYFSWERSQEGSSFEKLEGVSSQTLDRASKRFYIPGETL